MTTRSPVTAAKPRRSAAPLPAFSWRNSLKPSSFSMRSRISPVPSFEPSSTTMSSMRIRTARTRRMISSTVVRSLYTGITTDRSGFGGRLRSRRLRFMELETVTQASTVGNVTDAFSQVKRLAVFAPNWLGDAVMSLPALADVRRALPAARIEIIARRPVAPLFSLVPGVDDVVLLPAAGRERREGLDAIGRRQFDAAILLPNSFQAAWAAWRAGIPERWGYRTDWRRLLLTRTVALPAPLHQ